MTFLCKKNIAKIFSLFLVASAMFIYPLTGHAGILTDAVSTQLFEGRPGKFIDYTTFFPKLEATATYWNGNSETWEVMRDVTVNVKSGGYVRLNGTTWITDTTNPNVNVGDTLFFTPGYTQPSLIRWDGTVYVGDELQPTGGAENVGYLNNYYPALQNFNIYGWWMDDATKSSMVVQDPFADIFDPVFHYADTADGFGAESAHHWQHVALFRLKPRTHTITVTGPVNCSAPVNYGTTYYGTYPGVTCTVTGSGEINATIRHNAVVGDFTSGFRQTYEMYYHDDYPGPGEPNGYIMDDNVYHPSAFQAGGTFPFGPETVTIPQADVTFTFNEEAFIDSGLRIHKNGITYKIAAEPLGTLTSPFRLAKNGNTYGIPLVSVNDPNATPAWIQTSSGVKAMRIFP